MERCESVDNTKAEWDAVMDEDLKALFFTTQTFAKERLSKRHPDGGVIIASLLSFQSGIRVASYTTSKHGVAGLTTTLANEWAAAEIHMNAVAPGYIVSNNTAAVFLCSPAANYGHGTVLNVDGGWLAR